VNIPTAIDRSSSRLSLSLNTVQAGSQNEILERLGDFGLGEEHGQAVYRGALLNMELHREWLEEELERLAIERECEPAIHKSRKRR
jgi:hypothetical protein